MKEQNSGPERQRVLQTQRILPATKTSTIVLLLFTPLPLGSAAGAERVLKKTGEPEWVQLPEYDRIIDGKSFYADVMNHNREPLRLFDDRPATAHETTHLIHSYLRNTYGPQLGRPVNGFYVGNNHAVILEEPAIRKSAVSAFVPQGLRGDRYLHYVEKQEAWDDRPLYLFDEWVAYVNDSIVAIEEAAGGKSERLPNNGVHSCVEFCVYAAAVGMAVEKYDKRYFEGNRQFRDFLTWHLKRSMQTYKKGMRFDEFRWKPDYLQTLRNGTEAEPVRTFLEQKLGLNLKELLE